MNTVDLASLAKALAPLIASELREHIAAIVESVRQEGAAPRAPTQKVTVAPSSSSSPDQVIDRHGAREFGLSSRQFTSLAKAGAFTSFQLDSSGRFGAYRRDVQAWLEKRKWQVLPRLPPEVEPSPEPEPKAKPADSDLDQYIVRALETGKFRVIPGRKGQPARAPISTRPARR